MLILIQKIKRYMARVIPFTPFIAGIVFCLLSFEFIKICRESILYIHDDREMYMMTKIKHIEDSLVKATGKGCIDTVDFSQYNK